MTATLKRYLAYGTQRLFHVEVSSRKVAMCAADVLETLLVALSTARKKDISKALEKTLNYLKINAQTRSPKAR